jgi:type VI secretion system protein VasG
MEDAEGRRIDFRNTVILLTTNAGTETIHGLCADPELMPGPEGLAKALRAPLLEVFPPALLGRLVVVPYFPLAPDVLAKIVRLQLGRIAARVKKRHGALLEYGDDVVDLIVSRCEEVESGGRMVDSILTGTILPALSREFLERFMEGRRLRRVAIRAAEGAFRYDFDE